MKREHILKMVMPAMLVAIGVVISPILRVEGMCPMAHLINIVLLLFPSVHVAFPAVRHAYRHHSYDADGAFRRLP